MTLFVRRPSGLLPVVQLGLLASIITLASAWVNPTTLTNIAQTKILYTTPILSHRSHHRESSKVLEMSAERHDQFQKVYQQDVEQQESGQIQRRRLLKEIFTSTALLGMTLSGVPESSNALVKGNAPPPKTSAGSGKPKCTNVEECQAMAEQRETELRNSQEQGPPPKVTASGVRYIDIEDGTGAELKDGDEVQLYFKVLKLGKRSFDGISGEGTEVFSRGYGLEDDEDKPKTKFFETVVGSYSTIQALNDALVGMKVGGIRRFAILPQKGWQRPTAACDGGPGGRGTGGDLKTDYVIVPTATMVDQEACLDKSKQPFPFTYAQQRRMAQRFDQSLIMEVEVAKVK